MTEPTQISVTPPGLDKPDVRHWMEETARERGYVRLSWTRESDRSRLYGVKSSEAFEGTEMPPTETLSDT
jgi:hypothetical protein